MVGQQARSGARKSHWNFNLVSEGETPTLNKAERSVGMIHVAPWRSLEAVQTTAGASTVAASDACRRELLQQRK